jgi:hypothetical protein
VSLWTSLEPASTTVDPGGTATVRLRLRNTADVVDEYRFEPVGPVAAWTAVEPPTLRLYPGTTGTVELTFAPPRTPDAAAGPHPYAVRITPTEHPEAVAVPEGNLTVTPFGELRADMVPPVVKGRFRGRPRLAVDNLGNTAVTASLKGADSGDELSYELRPATVRIEPGRAVFVATTLRPRRIIWFGARQQWPYRLSVLPSGGTPLPVEGSYTQRGVLPRWLAALFGMVGALALAFAALWFTHRPVVGSRAVERTAEVGATLAPSPAATLPAPSSAPSSTPSPAGTPGDGPGPGGSGSGSGGSGKGAARAKKSASGPLDAWAVRPGALGADATGLHPAVPTGVTEAGGHGGCGVFHGKSSQLATTGPVLETGPGRSFTVSAWVYLTATGEFATAVSQTGTVNSAFYLQYSKVGDRWSFSRAAYDSSDIDDVHRAVSTDPPDLNVWTHLVGVFDAADGRMTLYVDGEPQGTATDATPFASGGPLVIGRAQSDSKQRDWFPGQIDEVAVWGRALTAAQVHALS